MYKFIHFCYFCLFSVKLCYNYFMKITAKNTTSRRSQQKIKHAFAELIAERRSIKNIHVTDLTARANITRGTFYRYYDNLNQVAEDFQQEIMQAFLDNPVSPLHPYEVDHYFDHLTVFLKQHEDSYRLLLNSPDTLRLISQISHKLSQNLYTALRRPFDRQAWLDVNFFVAGVATLLLHYFRNETDMSLDEINQYTKHKFRQTFPPLV